MSSFRALHEAARGLFALHRQSLLPHPGGWRQGRQGQPDPGRTRPAPTRLHRRLLPRGAGAAHVRHLAEAPASRTQARHRYRRGQPLPRTGLPARPQRPLRNPARGGRLSCPSPTPWTTSSAEERTVSNENTVRGTLPATPDRPPPLRQGQGPGPRILRPYPDHILAVFHGRLARYRSDGQPRHTHTHEAA